MLRMGLHGFPLEQEKTHCLQHSCILSSSADDALLTVEALALVTHAAAVADGRRNPVDLKPRDNNFLMTNNFGISPSCLNRRLIRNFKTRTAV